jgi:hypothetical protein
VLTEAAGARSGVIDATHHHEGADSHGFTLLYENAVSEGALMLFDGGERLRGVFAFQGAARYVEQRSLFGELIARSRERGTLRCGRRRDRRLRWG